MTRLIIALFMLSLTLQRGICADTLLINDQKFDYLLYENIKYLDILEDPTAQLSINEILRPEHQSKFQVPKGKIADVRNTSSAYWIKLYIKGESDRRWVLENLDAHIAEFEFYPPTKNGYSSAKKAGYTQPFNIREYPHKNFIFDIQVEPQVQVFYIKIKSNAHNPFLLRIKSTQVFAGYALSEYYLLGMFYGILAIMAIYNLLVYVSMKENLYLYYIIYVICAAIISMGEDSTGFQYLWPNHPNLNHIISTYAPLLLMLSFLIYSKSFLELKRNLPKIDRILNIVTLVYVIFFFVDTYILHLNLDMPLYIIPFIIIYLASFMCWKNGFRQARYYIIGYSFMFVSIILMILRMNGLWHSDSIFNVYSFNFGLIFEIVILSFALSDRIKIIRAEKELAQQKTIEQLQINEQLKDKVNRELEQKVSERTQELNQKSLQLEQANEKLNEQAAEITRMNLLLDADNRKLQKNVKELEKARVMVEDVDFEAFKKIFPDKNSCLRYIFDLKWEKGYSCKRCENTKFCEGKDKFSKRCTKCRYDESATAYTIFHRLKFDIIKAFYMVFLIYTNKGKITSAELSELLDLRQSTCWSFSKKVTDAMKERKKTGEAGEAGGWASLVLDHE